jgi:hypothetical protein
MELPSFCHYFFFDRLAQNPSTTKIDHTNQTHHAYSPDYGTYLRRPQGTIFVMFGAAVAADVMMRRRRRERMGVTSSR